MLEKAIPVLPVGSISKTIDFFETKLGFKATNYGSYAIMQYKNTEIHLYLNTEKSTHINAGCLIMVENIEDLYTFFCAKGLVELKGRLTEKPWGIKEFTLEDNNKNLIRFAEKP